MEDEKFYRDLKFKYYILEILYSKKIFLLFCSGIGYMMLVLVVKWIYDMVENVLFFLLEDVYIGFCFE